MPTAERFGVQFPPRTGTFLLCRIQTDFWGLSRLLSNGYREIFPGDKADGALS